jgi:hypothetical protein
MKERMAGMGFGRNRYFAAGRERPHMARSKLLANDSTEFVGLGEEKLAVYSEWAGRRYVAAEGLTYDFILTFYDRTSQKLSAMRLFGDKGLGRALKAGLKAVDSSSPDVEARIIGLQNGEDHLFLVRIADLLLEDGIKLVEADLFGREVRHIALDLRTGSSYNILPKDRSSKPGELLNHMTVEDFQREFILPPRS